jgi:hypothetical protein
MLCLLRNGDDLTSISGGSRKSFMVTKIVSGGQTGADRAALDGALGLEIPHGGWVPKGRKTERGPLPARFSRQAIPRASYPEIPL